MTVWQAIGDLPEMSNGGGAQKVRRDWRRATSASQRQAQAGTPVIFSHVCHALAEVNLPRVVHIPEGRNSRDIPRGLLPAMMQRARLRVHTKRYGRLDRDGFASTILTKCDPHWGAYIYLPQNRTTPVREAARLQGFPGISRFVGKRISLQCIQVGDAVPVPLARDLGRAVLAHRHTHTNAPVQAA